MPKFQVVEDEKGDTYIVCDEDHKFYICNAEGSCGKCYEYAWIMAGLDSLTNLLSDQIEWSKKTFGEGRRTEGLLKHIEKEVAEVRKDPLDVFEWIDIIILALDGAWRTGMTAEQVAESLVKKMSINMLREYPMPISDDEPSEHIR